MTDKEKTAKTENSYRILRVPKAVIDEVERRQRKIQLDKEYAGENIRTMDMSAVVIMADLIH